MDGNDTELSQEEQNVADTVFAVTELSVLPNYERQLMEEGRAARPLCTDVASGVVHGEQAALKREVNDLGFWVKFEDGPDVRLGGSTLATSAYAAAYEAGYFEEIPKDVNPANHLAGTAARDYLVDHVLSLIREGFIDEADVSDLGDVLSDDAAEEIEAVLAEPAAGD